MRSLSPTLLAAQKAASRIPCVRVEAKNKRAGIVRLNWTRLYTGTEADYYHAATIPGDGSFIRVRVTPPADARKLYRQRVADPSPESDFSPWAYSNQYNVVAVTVCSLGAEVSILWIKSDSAIYQQKSTDYGASWGAPELIDYSPTTAIYGIAASYKPNGDIGLFFADQNTLYVKKRVNGVWQNKVAWNKSTGDLSGVAAVYESDFNLLLTGKDEDDNFKLWSLIYGDGGELPIGTWSELKELASAPADSGYQYHQPFLAKPEVYRCFFIEKFTGTEAYSRPFSSHSVADTSFGDNLWHEPVPFNLSSEYGLAIAYHGDYCWLSNPGGVWRARLSEENLDLTADVISIRQELTRKEGRLIVELDNSSGRYSSPGQGELAILDIGCQLEISPGYTTSQGNESSPGLAFQIEALEHTSAGGKASLLLYAFDGWSLLQNWRARHQFRWNKGSGEMSVKDMLAFVLGRCGLKLEVKSQSEVLDSFYPDFTIHPGNRGDMVIEKLLSFVPDALFIEGNRAHLLNPEPSDNSVYSYGTAHAIFEGKYRKVAWELNRIQIEGYDSQSGTPIVVDSFSWAEINCPQERLRHLEDRNISSVSQAQERGATILRQVEMDSVSGAIRIPPNCGQQLYDVIDVTDSRAGLSNEKMRVLGITLVYRPLRGEYEQQLLLGAA